MPIEKGISIKKLSKETSGYTGADIEAIATEAGLFALRKNIEAKKVTKADFEKAMKKINPSVDKRLMDFYMQMAHRFKGPSAGGGKKKKGADEAAYIG
jgi:transitional endoplasmic reticulum ATPase